MKTYLFYLIVFFFTSLTFCQSKKKSQLKPYKIGVLYNYATNENFLNNDPDYNYSTNTYKAQVYYKLNKWKTLEFELIIQPQIQLLKHQLLNKWFITPDQDNVEEKIAEFTKPKNMQLYGIEFGFSAKKRILQNLFFLGTISLGLNYINTRTERLAKGFTFIENFSIGFSYKYTNKSFIYIGSNLFGHVSNLNFQKPNDGYNIMGLEIGYSYEL